MEAIKHLANETDGMIDLIVQTHKAWSEDALIWSTTIYEGLKKLSPTELVEALNKEASNG